MDKKNVKLLDELGTLLFMELNELFSKQNIEKFIEKLISSEPVAILTYREMINIVIEHKPDINVAKAAIVKRLIDNEKRKKYKLTIVYMDQNNKPIWKDNDGREICIVFMAKQLDNEILELFGNRDVLLIE